MLILLFPIVFMVHEFEEILFVKAWVLKNKNNPKVDRQYWIVTFKKYPISTATFASLIAEEYIIASSLTIIALQGNFYTFFVGLLIAYAIHLLKHLWDMVRWRRYVPGGPTALATLPIIVWMIFGLYAQTMVNLWQATIWVVVLGAGLILNLKLLYKISPYVEKVYRSKFS